MMRNILLISLLGLFSSLFAIDKNKLFDLDSQNRALFKEVVDFTNELLAQDEKIIKEKLKEFEDDPDSIDSKELYQTMQQAIKLAQSYGMDIQKITALYELSKKVILRSEFKEYEEDEKTKIEQTFESWVDYALLGEERINRKVQKIQDHKVALYKKVTMVYIKALMEKDAFKSYDLLKQYTQALQKIQSADADILIAQANSLVAEQKLVTDAISVLPFVGDSLDILSLTSGEDLSGEKLSKLERVVGVVLLLTPNVVEQVVKRNPGISRFFGKLAAYAADVKDVGVNKVANLIGNEKVKAVIQKTFKSRDIDKWRRHYYVKLREQEHLASLSSEQLKELIEESGDILKERKIKQFGKDTFDTDEILPTDLRRKIDEVAKKNNTIILARPVNKHVAKWLEMGASTKTMFVKGKSADTGVFAGLIPKKQKYSKLKNPDEIKAFQNKVDTSLRGETSYVNYSKREMDTFKKALDAEGDLVIIGNKPFTKDKLKKIVDGEIARPMVAAKQLEVPHNGQIFKAVELPKIGGDEFTEGLVVYKKDGKYFDEAFNEIEPKNLKGYDLKAQEPFEVLTDPKGNMMTADLDLLDVGTNKNKRGIMQDDGMMGNIDSHDMKIVNEINQATSDARFPNQNISHHGGEASFINRNSKPDFPIVAHAPDGQMLIESEEQLKAYYHHQKLKGYDLEPNPFWNWGEWDPTKGYQ